MNNYTTELGSSPDNLEKEDTTETKDQNVSGIMETIAILGNNIINNDCSDDQSAEDMTNANDDELTMMFNMGMADSNSDNADESIDQNCSSNQVLNFSNESSNDKIYPPDMNKSAQDINLMSMKMSDKVKYYCVYCNDAATMIDDLSFLTDGVFTSLNDLSLHIMSNHAERVNDCVSLICPLCPDARFANTKKWENRVVTKILKHLYDMHGVRHNTLQFPKVVSKSIADDVQNLFDDGNFENEEKDEDSNAANETDGTRITNAKTMQAKAMSQARNRVLKLEMMMSKEREQIYPTISLRWICLLCNLNTNSKDKLCSHILDYHTLKNSGNIIISCPLCRWQGIVAENVRDAFNSCANYFIDHSILVHGMLFNNKMIDYRPTSSQYISLDSGGNALKMSEIPQVVESEATVDDGTLMIVECDQNMQSVELMSKTQNQFDQQITNETAVNISNEYNLAESENKLKYQSYDGNSSLDILSEAALNAFENENRVSSAEVQENTTEAENTKEEEKTCDGKEVQFVINYQPDNTDETENKSVENIINEGTITVGDQILTFKQDGEEIVVISQKHNEGSEILKIVEEHLPEEIHLNSDSLMETHEIDTTIVGKYQKIEWEENPESDPNGSFECIMCNNTGAVFKKECDVLWHFIGEHVFRHTEHHALFVECPCCPQTFVRLENMMWKYANFYKLFEVVINHLVKMHGYPLPSFWKVLSCWKCGFETLLKQKFKEHMGRYHDEKISIIENERIKLPKIKSGIPADYIICEYCGKMIRRLAKYVHRDNCEALSAFADKKHNYRCKHCEAVFSTRIGLRRHLDKLHNKARNQFCKECGKAFLAVYDLWCHSWAIHGINLTNRDLQVCDICGDTTIPQLMNSHRNTHDETVYTCTVCQKEIKGILNFRQHKRWHTAKAERKLSCEYCGHVCPTMNNLRMHLACVHKLDEFRCHLCKRVLLSSEDLAKHMERKHPTGALCNYCKVCNKQLSSALAYENHMFVAHRVNITKRPILQCSLCGFETLGESLMKKHTVNHQTQVGTYACGICGKISKTERASKDHMAKQHGEKRHQCDHCSFRTQTKDKLRKHVVKEHTREHWGCSHCQYSCSNESTLLRHMRLQHGIGKEQENEVVSELLNQVPNAHVQNRFVPKMRKGEQLLKPGNTSDEIVQYVTVDGVNDQFQHLVSNGVYIQDGQVYTSENASDQTLIVSSEEGTPIDSSSIIMTEDSEQTLSNEILQAAGDANAQQIVITTDENGEQVVYLYTDQ